MWRSSRCRPRGPEDLRREVELRPPVVDDRRGRRTRCAHRFISPATCSAAVRNTGVAANRQLQVALVVQRHRRHLAERVLAVEHPAVGARQQRVGDVADALLRRSRAAWRPGPVPWIHWRCRSAGISLPTNAPSRASCTLMRVRGMYGVRIEERDALPVARARRAPCDPVAPSPSLRSASSGASASSAVDRLRREDVRWSDSSAGLPRISSVAAWPEIELAVSLRTSVPLRYFAVGGTADGRAAGDRRAPERRSERMRPRPPARARRCRTGPPSTCRNFRRSSAATQPPR